MLRSFTLPNATRGDNPMRFPLPSSDLGTITVLCGPNGAGKSYILRTLIELLDGKAAAVRHRSDGWDADVDEREAFLAHRPHNHKTQMTSIGVLSRKQAQKKPMRNDDDLRLKTALFAEVFSGLPIPGFSADEWAENLEYRVKFLDSVNDDEESVYWLKEDGPEFLRTFEDIAGGKLGLRRAAINYELVLHYDTGVSAAYGSWSDGQKSLFTIFVTITLLKPTLYLIDELENFLHPQFMSQALMFLKRSVRQVITASHHPHLIFGRAVDTIFYVETRSVSRASALPSRFTKHMHQPNPNRIVTKIGTDRAKLAAAYRLFDIKDAALLATAAHVRDAVSYSLDAAVLNLFECAAVPMSGSPYSDRQSELVYQMLSAYEARPNVVLDWGAGLGRTSAEISKLHVTETSPRWLLYEPFEEPRSTLEAMQHLTQLDSKVLACRSELPRGTAGVCLLTNVLHALNPRDFYAAIEDCYRALKDSEKGIIVVSEIYPLLGAERNAVPYPADELETFFRGIGFRARSTRFAVYGAEAYCLVVSKPPTSLPKNRELLRQVEGLWGRLFDRFRQNYDAIPAITSSVEQTELLNSAFGMATIANWFGNRGIPKD
jgi:ABC-type cobalamin/Fe3+-siderophores transport system ATPase subunit